MFKFILICLFVVASALHPLSHPSNCCKAPKYHCTSRCANVPPNSAGGIDPFGGSLCNSTCVPY